MIMLARVNSNCKVWSLGNQEKRGIWGRKRKDRTMFTREDDE